MLEKKLQEKELEKIKKQKEKEAAAAEKKVKKDKDKEASLKRKAEEKAEKAAAAAANAANPDRTDATTAKKRKRFTSHVLNDISTDDFAILQAAVRPEWPCPITRCENVKELVDGICGSYGTRATLARLRKGAAKKVLDAQKEVSCLHRLHHTCMSACMGLGDR